VTTQTGDNGEVFSQVEPVQGGTFSATVVLTAGRENTISVFATDQGRTGSDSVVITSTGSSAEDLRMTLTWDTTVDMDIYVRTPGPNGVADSFDGSTILWRNPSADGGNLDVDDTNGFGPENITFPNGAAAPGTYAFAAQAYNPPNNTTATLSVFVNGQLRGTFTSLFTADNQRDIYGTVSFPSGAIGPPIPESELCPSSASCVAAGASSVATGVHRKPPRPGGGPTTKP
jgi:uncharacterized protein YfaP (DUF2135 family)